MKLKDIFIAKQSLGKLAGLGMAPKTAYRVLKFARKFDIEHEIIEKQRNSIIEKLIEALSDEVTELKRGTPEFEEFVEKFNGVLEMDSELEVCPLKFDELLEAIGAEDKNVMSVGDLAVLEILFEE